MPSKFPTVLLPPLRGLNLRDDVRRLDWGELSEATNIILLEDGSTKRIDGYVDLISSLGSSPATSLYEFERANGSIEYLFEYSGTLYSFDPLTNTTRALISGLLAGAKIGFASYNDYLYFGNSYNENKKLTPTYRHYIARDAITTAVASDEATSVALANALKVDYTAHIASTAQHNAADTSNAISAADATDYASALTLANELKADFNAHRSQTGVHPSEDAYHEIEQADAASDATTRTLLNELKTLYNQHIGDARVSKWSITEPSAAPTVATTSSSGLEIGTYNYVYTFYNAVDATESAPATAASVTTSSGEQKVNVTAMSVSTDPQATHKRVYRTLVDGAIYYYLGQVTNRTTIYDDSTADASVGTALTTESTAVVPLTNTFILYNDRLYMAGNLTEPYRVFYSEALYPEKYVSAYNYIDFDANVQNMAKIANGLLILEKFKTWMLAGTTPYNFSKYPISTTVGCTNQDALTYVDGNPIWVSYYGIKRWNGSEMVNISDLIDAQLLTKNLDSASICYEKYNDRIWVFVASS